MAAFSTIIAGAGLAIAGYGAYQNYSNSSRAAEANAQASQSQAQIAALQAQGVDTDKQKLALATSQSQLQIETQRRVIGAQKEAESIRMRASVLDATRRRREIIRQQIIANANSLATINAKGGGLGGSQAAQSRADSSGRTGVNLLGVSQNLELGQKLFDVNNSISNIYLNAQDINEGYVIESQSLQNKALEHQRLIYRLGGQASNSYREAASYQSQAALGQGLTSLGGALMSNAQTIGRLGTYFTTPTPVAYNTTTTGGVHPFPTPI